MKSHEISEDCCPKCNYKFDTMSGITTPNRPKAGDVTVCLKCAAFLTLDSNMKHRIATMEELEGIEKKTFMQLMKARSYINYMKARGKWIPDQSEI